MNLKNLENKKILIVGFGVEGKSTYEFLKKELPKSIISITDKEINGENYLEKQKDFDIAIKSPGIKSTEIKIPYTTATNIFFENVKGKTIGITGTKGKSTTSKIIYEILKKAGKNSHLVGNINHTMEDLGKPMLTKLMETNNIDDIWVIELSSFMLNDIKYSPNIAVITSFFPDHMDYHKNLENYLKAKLNIVKYQTKNDYFIVNLHYEKLKDIKKTQGINLPIIKELPFSEKYINLVGEHNIVNIKIAITVANIFNINNKIILDVIKNFTSLPHRLETVGTYKNITFIDDAISTTPESTIAAINSFENIKTIFLGGKDRGYNFSNLAKKIIEKNISNLVLFPESGEKILSIILNLSSSYNPKILKTSNMQKAVEFAYANTPQGSICLLSTASPSYTIWKNFEEKGNLFKEYVKKLF